MKRLLEEKLGETKEKRVALYISVVATAAFTVYNFYLAFVHQTTWNLWVAIYYLCLMATQGMSLTISKLSSGKKGEIPLVAFIAASSLNILLLLLMIGPAILMLLNKRVVTLGKIPAIAIAAYTAYKVTMTILDFAKRKKNQTLLASQIRAAKVASSIMSILTLQNTLVLVFGSKSEDLLAFTFVSTVALLLFQAAYSITSMVLALKNEKSRKSKVSAAE